MGEDYWFDREEPDGSTLVLSVLSRSDFDALDVAQMNVGDDFGYFLFRMRGGEVVDVIGKTDDEHVFEVAEMLGMRPPQNPPTDPAAR